jgi:hypothetical protein
VGRSVQWRRFGRLGQAAGLPHQSGELGQFLLALEAGAVGTGEAGSGSHVFPRHTWSSSMAAL